MTLNQCDPQKVVTMFNHYKDRQARNEYLGAQLTATLFISKHLNNHNEINWDDTEKEFPH